MCRSWDAHRLQPHRLRTFKRSQGPAFAAKVENGHPSNLFDGIPASSATTKDPPAHVVVLSIDEKSQIQALERTRPDRSLAPGHAAAQTHGYTGHGTALSAALDVPPAPRPPFSWLTSCVAREVMPVPAAAWAAGRPQLKMGAYARSQCRAAPEQPASADGPATGDAWAPPRSLSRLRPEPLLACMHPRPRKGRRHLVSASCALRTRKNWSFVIRPSSGSGQGSRSGEPLQRVTGVRYRTTKPEQALLRMPICDLAKSRVRYEDCQIHIPLCLEGWRANPKRVNSH